MCERACKEQEEELERKGDRRGQQQSQRAHAARCKLSSPVANVWVGHGRLGHAWQQKAGLQAGLHAEDCSVCWAAAGCFFLSATTRARHVVAAVMQSAALYAAPACMTAATCLHHCTRPAASAASSSAAPATAHTGTLHSTCSSRTCIRVVERGQLCAQALLVQRHVHHALAPGVQVRVVVKCQQRGVGATALQVCSNTQRVRRVRRCDAGDGCLLHARVVRGCLPLRTNPPLGNCVKVSTARAVTARAASTSKQPSRHRQ